MPAAKRRKLEQTIVPVIPLRDVVIYPHMVLPLFVGRRRSIAALEEAMASEGQICLVTQKEMGDDQPVADDLYKVGTLSSVLQVLKLPDGTVKILVEGGSRANIQSFEEEEGGCLRAILTPVEESSLSERENEVLLRTLRAQFEQYVRLHKKIPTEIIATLTGVDEPGRFADTVAVHLHAKIADKQRILEAFGVEERVEQLLVLLEQEIDIVHMDRRIKSRIQDQLEENHREFYLKEQARAIQKELGAMEGGESAANEVELFAQKIEEARMSDQAKEKAEDELKKLQMMPPMSAEATVIRNYLDWLVGIPWYKKSRLKKDIKQAERVLDEDHYGLLPVKERILESLAVQIRLASLKGRKRDKLKGPIICLVGPPGVGKTSLGQSIARATGREFARIALGGVRDEAEIRGHRRTYIGAMPGKIIERMKKVKVCNPLILLDEVDKISQDFRGDPASALLEVLDPEQNHTFGDHYLEVDYDLSNALFIATSNSMNIPPALLDRMEIIRIPGYTEEEKIQIATRYVVPKQMAMTGLDADSFGFSPGAIRNVIRYYTREAGVRELERQIAKVCRKVVRELVETPAAAGKKAAKMAKQSSKVRRRVVTQRQIDKYLGVQRYRFGLAETESSVGRVCGLAWTEVGGELLTIEAVEMPGQGKSHYTGRLGDVMQESIQAALTVVRSRAQSLGIQASVFQKRDLHIHVPEGATPKDGPSAGIGMCTALVSCLTGIPVHASVAMTGEITLRGEVLPIGGLKEKLLAALRGGIKTVIIPEDNKKDLADVPENIKRDLEIRAVKWIDQVLALALTDVLTPLADDELEGASVSEERAEPAQPSGAKRGRIRPH